jgi:hypothetical protein
MIPSEKNIFVAFYSFWSEKMTTVHLFETTNNMSNFYEQLDIIFDRLCKIHGMDDELIAYKSEILTAYEKERGYRYEYIYRDVRDKKIYIDENGYVKLSGLFPADK